MISIREQEQLLASLITVAEVAEIVGIFRSSVTKRLERYLSTDCLRKGATIFYFKDDVHDFYPDVPVAKFKVNRELARKELLTVDEAAEIVGKTKAAMHARAKADKFISANSGKTVLITLTSLLDYYTPKYSTKTDKLLSPLVAKHLSEELPDLYAYIDKTFLLKVTDNSEDLVGAKAYIFLGDKIDKTTTYKNRMAKLKDFINNWTQEAMPGIYLDIFEAR